MLQRVPVEIALSQTDSHPVNAGGRWLAHSPAPTTMEQMR
jgi:hypothetical protein